MTEVIERKKSYLKHLRDRFHEQVDKANERMAKHQKNKEIIRREQKEYRDFWCDFLREGGVPQAFKNMDPMEIVDKGMALRTLQNIVKHIKDLQDRRIVVQHLNDMVTRQANGSKDECLQQELGLDIFRRVTGRNVEKPRFENMPTIEDVQKRNFLEIIRKGIWAYRSAAIQDRIKFNKAVMPRVKKENVVAPVVLQQQNVR